MVNLFGDYTIKTPAKYTGSLAFIFGKEGLISLDYDYQDFSRAELRPTSDPNFSTENAYMAGALGGVSTFRLGGEYRIKQVSLRGGYRFQQSPLADSDAWGDLQGYSFGIGYSFGPHRIDFAYSHSEQDVSQSLFDGGLRDALVNRVQNYYTLGYTLNF